MHGVSIRHMVSGDEAKVERLQGRYSALQPAAAVTPAGVYLSPDFEGGRSVFCAVDVDGRLVGLAPLMASRPPRDGGPGIMWSDIKVDPGSRAGGAIADMLLEAVLAYAGRTQRPGGTSPAELCFCYGCEETGRISHALAHGFAHAGSIYGMAFDLMRPMVDVPLPEGVTTAWWRMSGPGDPDRYIAAHNACFREAPWSVDSLLHFMRSPAWEHGGVVAAWAGDQLAGSVMVCPGVPGEGSRAGYTERVFVLPHYRRRGVGRRSVSDALAVLKEQGFDVAHLEVRAVNRDAVALYESLGYAVDSAQSVLSRQVGPARADTCRG